MKLADYEIKKVVKSGKGDVIFLTRELKEISATDRVLVRVDRKSKCIQITSFVLKK